MSGTKSLSTQKRTSVSVVSKKAVKWDIRDAKCQNRSTAILSMLRNHRFLTSHERPRTGALIIMFIEILLAVMAGVALGIFTGFKNRVCRRETVSALHPHEMRMKLKK